MRIETVQQLDQSLRAVGLPPADRLFNGDLFKLDYSAGDDVADAEEPAIIEAGNK